MQAVETRQTVRIEYAAMLLICVFVLAFVGHAMIRWESGQIQELGPTLKQLTFQVDNSSPPEKRVHIQTYSMSVDQHQDFVKEFFTKVAEHLPEKCEVSLVWTKTELILVLLPSTGSIKNGLLNAFVPLIRKLDPNLGYPANRRALILTTGKWKGSHGVAMPRKELGPAPNKPPA